MSPVSLAGRDICSLTVPWESLFEPYRQCFDRLDTDSMIIPCSRKKAEKTPGQKALYEAVLGNIMKSHRLIRLF